MLTKRMQVQACADALAGLNVEIDSKNFVEPWATCYRAITEGPREEANARLIVALAHHPDRGNAILREILSAKAGEAPKFMSLAELAENLPPIEWLWPGWLPLGMLTVFGAAQGSGKSFVSLDMAWRIIHGQNFPDGKPVPEPGSPVVYVDAEAVPQILNERAQNYQLNRKSLFVMMPDEGEIIDFGSDKYKDRLIELAYSIDPALIIIDALSSIHSKGQNNVEDVRELLGFLMQLSGSMRTGLLLIHHIRKPGGGTGMLNFDLDMSDLSGSGHITAMARVVWGLHVVQTGPDFDPNGPRELKMLKTNLGPYEDPLGFEFKPLQPRGVFLKWSKEAPQRWKQPTKVEECANWIVNTLREAGGTMSAQEIVNMGENEGFSRATIFRAKETLGGQIKNSGGRKNSESGWELSEPEK